MTILALTCVESNLPIKRVQIVYYLKFLTTTCLIGIAIRSGKRGGDNYPSQPPYPSEGPVGIAFGKSNDAAGGSRTYELSYKHTSKLQLPIMIYKFFEVFFNFLTEIICVCTYQLHHMCYKIPYFLK